MEKSVAPTQHHGSLDTHPQPFLSFKQKASCDVEESTGKLFEWFTYSESKTKTDESRVSLVLVNETELRKDVLSQKPVEYQERKRVNQLWATSAN